MNFEFIVINLSIFINNIIIIIIYVNDILFINFDKINIQAIKNKLHKKFKMIDLNLYIYYFDITITKDRVNRILRFKQIIYIKKFFINHDMIKLMIVLIFIINDKFYIVENNFVIIKKSYYVY